MTFEKHVSALLCSFLFLSGCITNPTAKDPVLADIVVAETIAASSTSASAAPGDMPVFPLIESETENQPRRTQIFAGNDQMIREPGAREPVSFFGESVSLNFEQAPVTQVVHVVMGEILGLDYVIEHPLTGDVTLRTRTPVPQDQLLGILESLLQANGAVMVRDANDRYFVGAGAGVSALMPGISSRGEQGSGFSNVVIPLNYIGAREMADILKPVAPESAFVRIDTRRNLLLLSGTRQQMDGWLSIVSTFDVDMLKGMSVGVFPLEHAPVQEVYATLVALLGSELVGDATVAGGPEAGKLVNVIPVERLNSLLVVTPRAHYLDQVKVWMSRLDQPPDMHLEQQLYVYPVQNGSAAHLAKLMSTLFSDSGSASSSADMGVAPQLTATRASDQSTSNQNSLSQNSSNQMGSNTQMNESSQPSVTSTNYQLEGGIKIVADEQSNALLIYAKRSEYRKIENAIRKLDIAPVQVLIEASIIEVSLNDELRYGIEWFLQESLGSGWRGEALLNLSDGAIGPQTPGFSFSVINPNDVIRAVISSLADKALVNVISNPSVMVLDNHTATIQVGNQQPIRSTQTITDGAVISSSIQYKDTGVMLSVTPSVNAGGMVNMEIKQSVTDVGQQDAATGQRSFLERNINSRVAIRSGETVVLGGLIRDNTSRTRSGIPVLHDVPVVGNLFGSTANVTNRTELLVMITPRVLTNQQELRDISQEMRSRMSGLRFEIDELEGLNDE